MNKERFIVFTLFLASTTLFAQNRQKIDSLEIALVKEKKDTQIVNILNALSHQLCVSNTNQATYFAIQALDIANTSSFDFGRATAYHNLGIIYDVKGDYDSSLFYYQSCIRVAQKINQKKLIANATNNIGLVHANRGFLHLALESYLKSLKLFESIGYKKGLANTMSNIGLIYSDLKNHKSALKYQLNALHVRQEINDEYGIGVSLTNIGLCYYNLGESDRALDYFFHSIELKEEVNDSHGLALVWGNIGMAFMQKNDVDRALEYYNQSLKMRSEVLNDKLGTLVIYNNMSEAYFEKQDYSKAKVYSDLAKNLGEQLEARQHLKVTYFALAKLYKVLNKMDSAFYYVARYDVLKDSIYSKEASLQISEMQVKYDTEKHKQENELLTQQNKLNKLEILEQQERIYLLLAISLFVILFSIFIYNRRKLRQTRRLNQEIVNQERIRLNAIIQAQENERKRIAEELHDGIGQTLSAVKLNVSSLEQGFNQKQLTNAIHLIDESCRDVRNIAHNLMPGVLVKRGLYPALIDLVEVINDSGSIKIHLHSDTPELRFDVQKEINAFRIVQELITNILKYAAASELQITITKHAETVEIMIDDNGKGFDKNELELKAGNGWTNINSRIKLMGAKLEIDSKVGKGTVAFIVIPV